MLRPKSDINMDNYRFRSATWN